MKTAENLCFGFGCWGKDFFAKVSNRQLTKKGLKVEKASAAVVDATIIQTAGSKQRQAIEVDEEGQVSGQTTPSKDKDAR